MAVRSKVWVCGRSLAGSASSKPVGGMKVCLVRFLSVLLGIGLCVGLKHVQRSPTEGGVNEYDCEVLIMR